MSTPKPGDRVRVTYEAVWDQDRGSHYWLRDETDGTTASIPASATVEVIDDPSKDLVGTVREFGPLRRVYARSNLDPAWPWVPFDKNGGNDHRSMVGCKVIGVVPGTPAAESKVRYFTDGKDCWRLAPNGELEFKDYAGCWRSSSVFTSVEQLLDEGDVYEVSS